MGAAEPLRGQPAENPFRKGCGGQGGSVIPDFRGSRKERREKKQGDEF